MVHQTMLLGILLTVMGFIIIILATILASSSHPSKRTRFGGLVMVGPFPIIFGERNMVSVLLAIAIMFMILTLILMMFGR